MIYAVFFVLILICAVLYLLTLPKDYSVCRSITIAKSASEVFPYVQDFQLWAEWSPWLLHDPQANITIDRAKEVGGSSAYESSKIGAGKTTHTAITPHSRIEQHLAFFKPFKSQAAIEWDFREQNGETTLTWTMRSSMPLPMRPFIPMMTRMIGLDFELGLAKLRGIADPNADAPKLHFAGTSQLPPQTCISKNYQGTLENMGSAMQAAFPALMLSAQDRMAHSALAAYHSVNLAKQTTNCDMAVPVTRTLPSDTVLHLTGGAYFKTELRGSYQFLGPAWNAAYGQAKMQKLKIDRKRPALEVYENHPDSVTCSNELLTFLYVPVKD